jgi:hypothetical protein
MDKKRFADLVRQQIRNDQTTVAPRPEELAGQFLNQVSGGNVNYPPGFINGIFASFQLGGHYERVNVPQVLNYH